MICAGEGTRQGKLVNWYLDEIEGDIDSVEMLAEKKVLVEKVIERLVHHVSSSSFWCIYCEFKSCFFHVYNETVPLLK